MNGETSYDIRTFGCKVNTYDTGLLQQRMGRQGFVSGEMPQVHILNTCAVTSEATNEALRVIRRLKKKEPGSVVVVTGCAAQVDTDQFVAADGADLVVANSHKGDLENILRRFLKGERDQRVFKTNIFKKEDLEPGGGVEQNHTRSFLKIQDGCNSFCSFCVIPFARGKSRSLSPDQLIEKISELEARGVREVVITGVHIGDYESDEGLRFEGLMERLLAETAMARFRISSLEPVEVSERLLDLYKDPRLCPHFHMSIQSANTRVLHEMKRHYSAREVEISLNAIAKRVSGAYVGMDVIAGFPGETEDEHQDSLLRLKALPWSRLHVFPYSQRPNTFAARLEAVPAGTIQRRALELRELSHERIGQAMADQLGSLKQVLMLRQAGGTQGLSRDYWTVQLPQAHEPGQEITVRITGYDDSQGQRQDPVLLGQPLIDTAQN